jgi:hypothetical protein
MKELGFCFRQLNEELHVSLPLDEQSTASTMPPTTMHLNRYCVEFHFTGKATEDLLHRKFGANATPQELYSLEWQNLCGYLDEALDLEKEWIATAVPEAKFSRFTICTWGMGKREQGEVEEPLMEIKITVPKNLFWPMMAAIKTTRPPKPS